MPSAVRIVDRVQDLADVEFTNEAGAFLVWDATAGKFTQPTTLKQQEDQSLIVAYEGEGDVAINVEGGMFHMSGGVSCFETTGDLVIMGLGVHHDTNSEGLRLKWDEGTSSYQIITEASGTGQIRPVTLAASQFVVKQTSGSGNIQEWRDSGGTLVAHIDSAGVISGSGSSIAGVAYLANANAYTLGPNTFNTGGASNKGLIVKGAGSQSANLQEWQNSGGTALSLVSASGKFLIGTNTDDIAAGIVALASNLVVKGSGTSDGTKEPLATFYKGSTHKSGLILQATDTAAYVYPTWGSSGQNVGLVLGSFTSGASYRDVLTINPDGASVAASVNTIGAAITGLVVKGVNSQSANLQEWQNSSGTALAKVGPAGVLTLGTFLGGESGPLNVQIDGNGTGIVIANSATEYIRFVSGGVTKGILGYGNVPFLISNAGNILIQTIAGYAVELTTGSSSSKGLIVKGAASQSANLQEWQNSSGTALLAIDASGSQSMFSARQTYYYNSTNTAYVQLGASASAGGLAFVTSASWPSAVFGITAGGLTGVGLTLATVSAQLHVVNSSAAQVAVKVVGAASQSANLQEWQNSSGTVMSSIGPGGAAYFTTTFASGVSTIKAIGIASSTVPCVDVWSGGLSIVIGGDVNLGLRTDATDKVARIGAAHYTNAEEPIAMMIASASSSTNVLNIGGGSSALNAATSIQFLTGATNTTTSGTARATIDSTGLGVGVAPSNRLHVVGPGTNAVYAGLIDHSFATTGAGSANGLRINSSSTGLQVEKDGTQVLSVIGNEVCIGQTTLTNSALNVFRANSDHSSGTAIVTFTGTTTNAAKIIFDVITAGATAFTVDGAGKIGMGINSSIGAKLQVNSIAAGTVGLIVKGTAAQSAHLQQWQNSSGTVLSRIEPDGSFVGPYLQGNAVYTNTIYDLATSGAYMILAPAGPIVIRTRATTNKGLTIRGESAQTANLQEWTDSTPTTLSSVNSSGYFGIGTAASANTPLSVLGISNQWGAVITGSATSGQSYGLKINASTTGSSDHAIAVYDKTQTDLFFYVSGTSVQVPRNLIVGGSATSGASIAATCALDNNWVATLASTASTSGQSYGLLVDAGTTSADHALRIRNKATTSDLFNVRGDGLVGVGTLSPGAQLHTACSSSGTIGLIVRAAASQSANLQEWQNSGGSARTYIDASGDIVFNRTDGVIKTGSSSNGITFPHKIQASGSLSIGSAGATASAYATYGLLEVMASTNGYIASFSGGTSSNKQMIGVRQSGFGGTEIDIGTLGSSFTDISGMSAAVQDVFIDAAVGSNRMLLCSAGVAKMAVGSTVEIATSLSVSLTSKTANYTLTSSDMVCVVDATSNDVTVTLPTAVGVTGRIYVVKRIDSTTNVVAVVTTSSQTIDGSLSFLLANIYESVTLISNGSNWSVI